eukprot:386600-Pleurochrysis_carterae.AAC.1
MNLVEASKSKLAGRRRFAHLASHFAHLDVVVQLLVREGGDRRVLRMHQLVATAITLGDLDLVKYLELERGRQPSHLRVRAETTISEFCEARMTVLKKGARSLAWFSKYTMLVRDFISRDGNAIR